MAKLGRYSANRIKCQSLTADYTITKADCGTLFTLDKADGIAVTLPTVANAGSGWWCRIVVGTNISSNTGTITAEGALMRGGINELEVDTNDDGPSTVGGTTITIANAADTIGDYVELYTNGTLWFVSGQSKLDGAFEFDA
jgi:hypothetical protein